jgi:hypothetical protein
MAYERESNIFSGGFITGVASAILMGWILVSKVVDAQSPMTWCDDVAQASTTEPYQVVYDRCYKEYEERKRNKQ